KTSPSSPISPDDELTFEVRSRNVESVEGAWPRLWILIFPKRSTMKIRPVSAGGAVTKTGCESPLATTTPERAVFGDSETPVHAYWALEGAGTAAARTATSATTIR